MGKEALGAKFFYEDIPFSLLDKAQEYRSLLLDTAAGMDDEAMNVYFEFNDLPVELLKKCVRSGTIKGTFVPVLCGSAFKNKGVQPLLNSIVDFLPSPIDVNEIVGTDPKNKEKKL